MRKTITLGLFALMVSLFSSQVLAGKIQVCEDIKKDPAYKGLYGLCNAYWNATNEDARANILANFERKAGTDNGGPGMPGLEPDVPEEVVCPCTDGMDTDSWGMLVACSNDGTGDMAIFVNPVDNFTTQFMTMTEADVSVCSLMQSPATFIQFDINMAEYDVCLDQLLTLCE